LGGKNQTPLQSSNLHRRGPGEPLQPRNDFISAGARLGAQNAARHFDVVDIPRRICAAPIALRRPRNVILVPAAMARMALSCGLTRMVGFLGDWVFALARFDVTK